MELEFAVFSLLCKARDMGSDHMEACKLSKHFSVDCAKNWNNLSSGNMKLKLVASMVVFYLY